MGQWRERGGQSCKCNGKGEGSRGGGGGKARAARTHLRADQLCHLLRQPPRLRLARHHQLLQLLGRRRGPQQRGEHGAELGAAEQRARVLSSGLGERSVDRRGLEPDAPGEVVQLVGAERLAVARQRPVEDEVDEPEGVEREGGRRGEGKG
jgi:hypothetical protein